jgi:CheY-like chemotaxis protein
MRVGGMDALDASNGPDGIRKAEEEQPDAILLDVMMPGMDGPAVLAALRKDPATAHIPVIFLTGKGTTADVERLTALGAVGVLAKPFDPATLPGEVRRLLAGGRPTP